MRYELQFHLLWLVTVALFKILGNHLVKLDKIYTRGGDKV